MVTRLALVAVLGALLGTLTATGGALWPEAPATQCCGARTTAIVQTAWHGELPRRAP
jgi:hypothetical protein